MQLLLSNTQQTSFLWRHLIDIVFWGKSGIPGAVGRVQKKLDVLCGWWYFTDRSVGTHMH